MSISQRHLVNFVAKLSEETNTIYVQYEIKAFDVFWSIFRLAAKDFLLEVNINGKTKQEEQQEQQERLFYFFHQIYESNLF